MTKHRNIKNIDQNPIPKYKPIAIPTAIQNKINPQILRKLYLIYNELKITGCFYYLYTCIFLSTCFLYNMPVLLILSYKDLGIKIY